MRRLIETFIKILLTVFLLAVVIVIYSHLETYWVQVKETDVINKDVPQDFDGLKVVFISDIHLGPDYSASRLGNLVSKINGFKPDIILIGGDYINHGENHIDSLANEIKKLKAPMGVFGVLGNHDHWANANLVSESLKNAGVTMLDNKSQWIHRKNGRIKLGGVGDLWTDTQDIEPTIKDVKEEDFVVLLSHHPDYVDQLKDHKVDLVLSGHTHGGQATLFGWRMPFTARYYKDEYRTGVIDTENTKLIVTNGIGTAFRPMRFFARPQINVIYLKRNEPD